jgi:hypothetical protein
MSQEIKRKLDSTRYLLNIPGINGLSYGFKRVSGKFLDEMAICVHVEDKLPKYKIPPGHLVPSEVNGEKTDVIQTRTRPLSDALITGYYDVLAPGISIGNTTAGSAGTLGAFIYGLDNEIPYVLTNYHVALNWTKSGGSGIDISQPAIYDGGSPDYDLIGKTKDYYLDNDGDVAIIALNGERPLNRATEITGISFYSVAEAQVGDLITKVGRTTGKTEGVVTSIGWQTTNYGVLGNKTIWSHFVHKTDDYEVMDGHGDSGSIMYDSSSGIAKSLLYAGSTDFHYGIGCSITTALQRLKCSITQNKTGTWGKTPVVVNNVMLLPWTGTSTILEKEFSLTPPADLKNVYLYTDVEFYNTQPILFGRVLGESDWLPIYGVETTPVCFLGDLFNGIAVSIEIKILTPLLSLGKHTIPIYVGYGDNVYPSIFYSETSIGW